MAYFKVALALMGLVGATLSNNVSVSRMNGGGQIFAPGDIMFEDNFDSFDLATWEHEITMSGGGNWEFQVYTNSRTNSFTKDGILNFRPTLTNDKYGDNFVESGVLNLLGGSPADACTNPSYYGCERSGGPTTTINPVMSARIRTVNSFSFKYGKVEVRAKLPAGDWLWPAIWMMPRYNQYGTWPASGEIDIMESRGNRKLFNPQGVNIGSEQFTSTLHFGPNWNYNGFENAHLEKNQAIDQGFDREFHIYTLEWTPEHMKVSLDNVEVGTITPPAGGFWELGDFPADVENPWVGADNPRMAPFDQEFYLILNLATGGTNGYFPPDSTPAAPWKNAEGNAFGDFWAARNAWYSTWDEKESIYQVDYVRVYAV